MTFTYLKDKTKLVIAVKYNNGLYKKYDLASTAISVIVVGYSLEITGTINIGGTTEADDLLSVEEVKYQISTTDSFRITKLNNTQNNYFAPQQYSRTAFISMQKP